MIGMSEPSFWYEPWDNNSAIYIYNAFDFHKVTWRIWRYNLRFRIKKGR